MPDSNRSSILGGARVEIFQDAADACRSAADAIASTIRRRVEERGKCVLGLATGSTPIPVYAHLVEDVRAGRLSFQEVTSFNLDEYYPISPLDPQSYRSFMHRNLFEHVEIAPNRAHVLDGTVPEAFAAQHAADFDRWIAEEGGIDIQLLGLGRNGHIGFNEPSDLPTDLALNLPPRLVDLHPTTLADASKDFVDPDLVPRSALTMGIAPILASRSILVLAFGERKAEAVARSLRGPITAEVPGSLLQAIPGKVTWLLDPPAASQLD